MGECQFEQVPLNCDECGAFVGVLGTCDDHAWCEHCNSKVLREHDKGMRSGYDLVYSPQEEKGKPPMHVTKVPTK